MAGWETSLVRLLCRTEGAGLGTRLSSELLDPVMGGTVMSIRLSSIAASYSVWTKVQIRIFQSLSPDYGDCVYEAAGSGSLDHRLRSGGGKVFANIRYKNPHQQHSIVSMPGPIVPSFRRVRGRRFDNAHNAQDDIVTNQTIQGQRVLAAGEIGSGDPLLPIGCGWLAGGAPKTNHQGQSGIP
ncbi:hypothetical protein An16g03670 [Aspergillus niger]|uniref:Uncharacterized protein n=2 Tax=Aspergillus niger TaxID=5061 RepID=A2R7I7_ASPNC|nr:hypothetical protein An16g03670 [Aspergillus niger]CAK42865.1 hypothetical protein An16g03670 [Aspergillus niger]